MVARRTPDHVKGAHPIEQSEVDRRSRGSRQYGDDSDGEDLFERHLRGRYARKLGGAYPFTCE
jgi:hypothetical protein